MRKNKIYLTLLSALLFLALGVGILTRFSFVYDIQLERYTNNGEHFQVSLDDDSDYLSIYFDNQIDHISQLKTGSDLILKVKTTKNRDNMMRALRSQVDVLAVYKGDNIKKGDRINLYEPSSFYAFSYTSMGGYNIMQEGEEYIVFLKHLKVPEGYKYKGEEERTFIPVSSYYGKFPIKNRGETEVISEKALINGKVIYDRVKNYEIITSSKQVLEKYYALKQEVLQVKK